MTEPTPTIEEQLRETRQLLCLADLKLEKLIGHKWERAEGLALWRCARCGKETDAPIKARLDPCPMSAHERLKRLCEGLRLALHGEDGRPVCPDCGQICVKTHIEMPETDGTSWWFTGWACECGYEGEPDPEPDLLAVRRCRLCGCTDDDCRQCIERTGHPCYWVEDDLCSACAALEGSDGTPAAANLVGPTVPEEPNTAITGRR